MEPERELRQFTTPDMKTNPYPDASHRVLATRSNTGRSAPIYLAIGVAVVLSGCSKSTDITELPPPETPKEAATQLEQVFIGAPPESRQNADVASQAMAQGDYEKAVVSLQAIRSQENLTLQQGLAIHNSTVAMEARLIDEIERGNENAKRAYDLLKRMKRD